MRTKREIDPNVVERLAAIGCSDAEIATIVDISERHLRRRFRVELTRGRSRLCAAIRRWQLRAARRGNVAMLIWLGKQYLGQKDRQEVVGESELQVVERLVFREAPGGQNGQAATDGDCSHTGSSALCDS